MQLPFIKCHGSGNDFVMIDEALLREILSEEQIPEFCQLVCDREGLIGGDGVLLVGASEHYGGKMIMYNADGTEAEMCGNGMRCVARRLFETTGQTEMDVEASVGSVPCSKAEDLASGVYTVSTVVGPADLDHPQVQLPSGQQRVIAELIPELDAEARFTALSIPNPHLIAVVPEIDEARLLHWGEQVIAHPELFPNGINVSMVLRCGENHIFVKTNERGSGLTLACGTAMSASAYVSCLLEVCDASQPLLVRSEGGITSCQVLDNHTLRLTGNATYVYEAEIHGSVSPLQLDSIHITQHFNSETEAYQTMMTQAQF